MALQSQQSLRNKTAVTGYLISSSTSVIVSEETIDIYIYLFIIYTSITIDKLANVYYTFIRIFALVQIIWISFKHLAIIFKIFETFLGIVQGYLKLLSGKA